MKKILARTTVKIAALLFHLGYKLDRHTVKEYVDILAK